MLLKQLHYAIHFMENVILAWNMTLFHSVKAQVPRAFIVLALECGIFQPEHNLLHIDWLAVR